MIVEPLFKNVEEVYDFLDSRNKYGSQLGLETMEIMMSRLGHPENLTYTIHIAGTNGKGSVGAYLSSILRQGRCVAFHFSSPAVFHPREVWRRCCLPIGDFELKQAASRVYEVTRELDKWNIHPTRFEVETAIAICGPTVFGDRVLILETGMGGAEDATNIIPRPDITAFTNIGYDHMQFLGNTLTEIATVKAGIIKPACPVFSATQVPEVKAVLDEKVICEEVYYVDDSSLELISLKAGEMKFRYRGQEYETPLASICQMQNAALAIDIARYMKYPDELIVKGIKEVVWHGRFEVLSKEPYFIIDGAHNVHAVQQLAETIKIGFTNQRFNFIIGVLKDKEHEKMMEIMAPFANRIFTVTPPNERGLDAKILAEEIKQWHEDVVSCDSIEEAVNLAMDYGRETGDITLAFGSLSYLGDVKKYHDIYLKK